MKPKSIRRRLGLQSTPSLALVTAITAFATGSSFAVDYRWIGTGSASASWSTLNNWNANGVGAFNATGGHRLDVNGTQKLVYSAAEGTTVYAVANRGLVIGSGGPAGTLEITGGSFSTVGSTGIDLISNSTGTSRLFINGGTFISGTPGMILGNGLNAGQIAVLDVLLGNATVAALSISSNSATVNLDGGILSVNNVSQTAGSTGTLNLNGGTLKARQTQTAFVTGLSLVNVKSGGAVIDTNTFNVTIGNILRTDPVSTGGGLIKKSSGLLTLDAPSTITGPVTIEAGGLGVKAGATSWTPSTLTHSGNILNFNFGVYNIANPPIITVAALTLNTIDTTVNISGSDIPVASEIKILDYGTKSGSGSLKLNIASLPSNMVATLNENTVDGYYYLNVTSPSANSFTWSRGTGNWDTTSLNWNTNTVAYAQPALVTFPNLTSGGTVTVTQNVSPIAVTINNNTANPYVFDGIGLITGTTGISKSGTGLVKLNGAAHTFSGAVTINAGAMIKQVADATTGPITVTADDASFVLSGGITDGAGQTLAISGRGVVANDTFFVGSSGQRGALQAQSGSNTWQGAVVLASNSGINRIGVQNGASLNLTGMISQSVAGAQLIFRAANLGDDITLSGTGTYSYTGLTQLYSTGGSIILGASNKLPIGSSMEIGFGGSTIFDLNGFNQELAGIFSYSTGSAGIITNNGTNPSTLTTTNRAETPTETPDNYPTFLKDGANTLALVKKGGGTQILSADNSYSGTTTVTAGRLQIGENQSATGDVIISGGNIKLAALKTLLSGVNLSIASGAFFYTDGSSQTLAKLEGNGTIDFTIVDAGVDTLTVGANDATSTFGGVIRQSTPRTHALTKIGTGTLTLTGLNTYTGNTTIESGQASFAQSNFANASTVTIGLTVSSPAVLDLPNAGTDIVAQLIIDGVSQAGNGSIFDATNSGGAITGLGRIQVGISPVSGYANWATANNVLLGESGDDDKDGIINLIEYALGLNPQVGSPAPGSFTGNTLFFTKGPEAKAALDVAYKIETSTTLETGSWTEAAATETVNDISFLFPSNQPGGKLFGRLKVTKP